MPPDGTLQAGAGIGAGVRDMRPAPQTYREARRRWESGEGSRFRAKLDRRECSRCGSMDRPLHVHHIESREDEPAKTFLVSNVEICCLICHKLEHGTI